MNKINLLLIFLIALLVSACKNKNTEPIKKTNKFNVLINYLETEANYINAPETPFYVYADEVYANLQNNILVIDLRDSTDFVISHIINSVNVKPNEIINYFENNINPPLFKKIILVSNEGFSAGFTAMCMRYLGYMNVYALKFGLSSWSKEIADKYWLANLSDTLINMLDTTNYPKKKYEKFPQIISDKENAYDLLYERVKMILNDNFDKYTISINDIIGNEDKYYLLCYWPEDVYKKGHIKNSVQYTPKESLKKEKFLNTLPTDQKIVVYCYSGTHASYVTAFLRILGYDAAALKYGSNSFMYSRIKSKDNIGKYFSEEEIFNYPLESTIEVTHVSSVSSSNPKNKSKVKGGC